MTDIPRNHQDGTVVEAYPALMVMDITHDKRSRKLENNGTKEITVP